MDPDYFLAIEIWQEIISRCEFVGQIRLRQVCKKFHSLEIHDFYNIDLKYLKLLSNQILFAYPSVKYLNVYNNQKVTTINHMTKLEKLHAGWNSGIN